MNAHDIYKVKSYEINKGLEIGRGQFGIVYQCTDLQNPHLKLCAKIIEDSLDDPKVQREIELMKIIMTNAKGNKNIVRVEYVEYTKDRIVMIMEKCECDLQSVMEKKQKGDDKYFKPSEALNILKQLVNGYKMLYFNKIIHRDLKPANILILNGVYKIADLGLARVLEENTEFTKVGTPKYVAPQLYFEKYFSNSADIFSLGIIIYELIFGKLPYVAHNQTQIKRALKNLEANPIVVNREWPEMTSEFADLIESMLKYKEDNRISWERLLKHPLILEESNLVVNQSGLIQNTDSDDEKEEETAQIPDQKQVQTQNIDQQVPPICQNLPKPTFTAPLPQAQKQLCLIDSRTQPVQFPQGKVFSTPFPTNFPVPPNTNSFIAPQMNQQPKQFMNPQPQRFPTISQMHILGQPLQFQQVKGTSDQLFQTGFVMDQALENLDKYLNMQSQLKAEFFGIKLYLHCLAQCFFEHSSAMQKQNQKNPNNQSYYQLQVIDQELQKKIKYHSVIAQELERYNLTAYYPVTDINPDFGSYILKLNRITANKGLFAYSSDTKYYPDYLQLLYFLEKVKDINPQSFGDIYLQIVDICKNYKNEQIMTDYLGKRL
ncbi:unnamed protein product (macronuclear) [Paramecium tetraurelia]|uniref:Protein kinase domain-containing protein n=1 Tax=Paramecium tetraurelia TaxID=5888 RepID=A0C2T2_PARTE|nr:uncharacterized protein GSPATT00034577001 [Paramecium tetraurelia]CAK65099.1 unnamed protein product [Paramecium tetraurelia]|eukprot:XP_001432496.1 hypothetical protein (macronuclear) [Paramecium tetraurelia strain d4-2]